MVQTEVQTIEAVNQQVSTPKIWDRESPKANIGDIIHAPFMPVMQVMDKRISSNHQTWLLMEPTNATCPKQWVTVAEDEG